MNSIDKLLGKVKSLSAQGKASGKKVLNDSSDVSAADALVQHAQQIADAGAKSTVKGRRLVAKNNASLTSDQLMDADSTAIQSASNNDNSEAYLNTPARPNSNAASAIQTTSSFNGDSGAVDSLTSSSGVTGGVGNDADMQVGQTGLLEGALLGSSSSAPLLGALGLLGAGAVVAGAQPSSTAGTPTTVVTSVPIVTAGPTSVLTTNLPNSRIDATTNTAVPVNGSMTNVAAGTPVTLTFTDQSSPAHSVTMTATVDPSGNYSTNANLSTLSDGLVTVSATALDGVGNPVVASDSTDLEAILDFVNVTLPRNVYGPGSSAVPITGSTGDIPVNAVVTVVLKDSATTAHSVTVTASVKADHTYSTTADLSTLTDGAVSVVASADEYPGETFSGSNYTNLSIAPSAITVVAPSTAIVAANVSNAPISGTMSHATAGTVVTLTISDATLPTAQSVTVTATVAADGTYATTADLHTLHDGALSVVATGTGTSHVAVSATTHSDLEAIADVVNVVIPTAVNAAGSTAVPVSGSTSDIPPGATVTLVLTDSAATPHIVTATTIVDALGNYSTSVNLASLSDGSVTVKATANEYANEPISGTSSTVLNIAPAALVVTPVANITSHAAATATPISGTSTHTAPGTPVTVVITDATGASVTVTTAVGPNGAYSTNADLSALHDGALHMTASVTGSSGAPVSTTSTTDLEAVVDIVTVNVPTTITALTHAAVAVTGSTADIPAGATVTVVLTDSSPAHHNVTVTSVVGLDGKYSTTADLSSLTDGAITVVAKADEYAGETITGTTATSLITQPSSLSVIVPVVDATTVHAANITGATSSINAGSVVTLTITDSAPGTHHSVTTTASVNADGTYTAHPDLSTLTDGTITANATMVGASNAPSAASSSSELEVIPDVVTANIPAEINAAGKLMTAVTGSTADIPVGATVTVTLSDSDATTPDVVTTAVVQADHTYTAVANLTGLKDGTVNVVAKANELTGDAITGHTTTILNTVPTISTDLPTSIVPSNASAAPITGSTTNAAPGSTVTVLISDADPTVHSVTVTATVTANGTYSTTANLTTLTDGAVHSTATVTSAGQTAVANDTADLEIIPDVVSVSVPTLIMADHQSAVPVTGSTSDIPVGAVVSIVLNGISSATEHMTVTATVQPNGTYSTTADLSSWAPGAITAVASATEKTGDVITGNTVAAIDCPDVTTIAVAVPATIVGSNHATSTAITGMTTDTTAGATVTLVISDMDPTKHSVTATATVNADGTYTATPNLNGLTDGHLDVTATVTGSGGKTVTAAGVSDLELVPDLVTVQIPTWMTTHDKSAVSVSGTTSDIAPHATVTITLSDTDSRTPDVTVTAEVKAGGTYSTTADLTPLGLGAVTAVATANEVTGDTITGHTIGTIDRYVASTITNAAPTLVDASNVAATKITGGVTNVSAGETVTVVISDTDPSTPDVTVTTVVKNDGTYTVSPNLSGLSDSMLTISSSVTGITGTVVTAVGTSELEAVPDLVTVALPDTLNTFNNTAVAITGTTSDIRPGATVTVVLSDTSYRTADVTVTTTVGADGTYSTTADLHTLANGVIVAIASAKEVTGDVISGGALSKMDTGLAIDAHAPAQVDATNATAMPITGTTSNAAPGSVVTLVVSDNNPATADVTVTTTVNADGTYTATPNLSTLTDGALHTTATVTTTAGAHASATVTGDLEAIADLVTVAMPTWIADETKSAVTITGTTSDIPKGAVVTVVLSDSDATTPDVTATATVANDGTYSLTANLSSLVNGPITANASAQELTGDTVKGSAVAVIDHAAASTITETLPAMLTPTNVSAAPITGSTSHVAPGAVVSVVVSDENPATPDITVTTTVKADGTYTVTPNLSTLSDGGLHSTATVNGVSGTSVSASNNSSLDLDSDSITLGIPSAVTSANKAATPITGNAQGAAANSVVTLVLSDTNAQTPNITVTTTVDANGNYSTNANLTGLVDGLITATATIVEPYGEVITNHAATILTSSPAAAISSTVASIDSTNVTATPVTGTATNTPAGATVTVVISDQLGHTASATATVAADGSYTAKPDLSHLADGNLAVTTSVTGTSGTTATTTSTSVLEVVPDVVTVSLPTSIAPTATSAVAVTGSTSDIPVGGTVTVVLNDSAGHSVTTTAVVQADHTYTSTANLSTLSVGAITATGHAAEATGEIITGTAASSVIGVNHVPVVSTPLTSTGTENAAAQTINLLANATDADGDAMTVTGVDYSTSGTGLAAGAAVTHSATAPAGVSLSGNTLTVDTSNAAFNALAAGKTEIVTASYTISDGHGGSTLTTSTTTITGVNDAPVLAAGSTISSAAVMYPATGATSTTVASSAIEGTVSLATAATGWHVMGYTPDIISGNGTYPLDPNNPSTTNTASNIDGTSSNGGTMQSLLSQSSGGGFSNDEAVYTTLTGLTVGKTYTYTAQWQQDTVKDSTGAVNNFSGGQLLMQAGHVTPDVNGGDPTLTSNTADKVFTSSGLSDGWQTAAITFVADSTTEDVALGINGLAGVATTAATGLNVGGAIVVDSVGLTTSGSGTALGAGATLASIMPASAVTDVDLGSSLKGWAITSAAADTAAATAGHWEYASASAPNTWTALTGASTTQAVFLAPDTLVRWNGTTATHTALSALAVDDTSTATTAGTLLDVSTTGGTTPYSTNIATLASSVSGGTNHAPAVSAPLTSTGAENAAAQTINLLANATDADGDAMTVTGVDYSTSGTGLAAGAAVTHSATAPAGVSLSGNTLTVDTSNAAFNALAAGKTEIVTASYTISDGHGGSTLTTSTTTITGVNDAPVLAASSTITTAAAMYPSTGASTTVTSSAIEGTVGLATAATGWHILGYTPDIITGNGTYPVGGSTTNTASNIDGTSSNGGKMQSLLSQNSGGGFSNDEAVYTTLTGLTVGKTYTYTAQWQQDTVKDSTGAVNNFSGGQLLMQAGHVTPDVNGGDPTLTSNTADKVFTSSGLSDGWQTAAITFVADATTEDLALGINGLNGVVSSDALALNRGGAIVVDSVGLTTSGSGTTGLGAGATLASIMPASAVTDVDLGSSLKGWAITSAAADTAAATAGHWEYASASAPNTWTALTGASTTQAVFLAPDTLVRWNGTTATHTALSALAVDDTTTVTTAGTLLDVSTTGGTTPYSINTATLAAATGPVVLDLNHDGAISYGHATMDLNGDGHLVNTAWTGSQDGTLVWDRYQDGQVHDQSQFAFSQYGGATDLAGLKAFDTNGNGLLDAGDALFSQFKVWQDKNGDGKVEAGEMLSLNDLGIKSIALTSDNASSTPAAGVLEFGHAVVTHTDGSTSVAADAMFDHTTVVSNKLISQLVDSTTVHVI